MWNTLDKKICKCLDYDIFKTNGDMLISCRTCFT